MDHVVQVTVLNELGQALAVPMSLGDGRSELDVAALPGGVYTVMVVMADRRQAQRLLVRH